MDNVTVGPRPKWALVVAVLALLWNLVGVAMCWIQVNMSAEAIAALPEAQRAVYEATPVWLNAAFAVAVVAGTLGALGLLLRRGWAVALFALSLLALVVQVAGAYLATPAWQAYGPAGLAMPVLLLVIAVALWRHAVTSKARGWIR